MRVRLDLAYSGAKYAGWQRQSNGGGVQDAIEGALRRLYGRRVTLTGAGRTDAGVHAEHQVAHFDAPRDTPSPHDLETILNKMLPEDISVFRVRRAPPKFHARSSASSRTYRYRIMVGPTRDPFRAPWVWHFPPAARSDLKRMRAESRRWTGVKDFAAFGIRLAETGGTRRDMKRIDIRRAGDEIHFTFTANSFLRRMVRRMVAYLTDVGMGKHPAKPAYAAPAGGLCLVKIVYGGKAK